MRVATFISDSLTFFFFFVFFFLFCHTGSMWKFLGQRSNLGHTAATRATVVRTQEPQPIRPSENRPPVVFISLARAYPRLGDTIHIFTLYLDHVAEGMGSYQALPFPHLAHGKVSLLSPVYDFLQNAPWLSGHY